ncbi:hypothetical protein CONLIGDRAFT_637395 [Coniochaeta ligniaria NRRL 30616]|uniref:Uncharacterized protein n=1 Tax=Coniochaeta ligniaria NRRL 30616 TaxID=1408157 RepID=A0A1J7I7Q4_9PEZI|nr:hypothetical protein CONLIGDRAFT_637395 [Coniochaeta ligniaria NRRL 30616]
MSSSGASSQIKGPPYLPSTQAIGGTPTLSVDDPICAVLIFLFAVVGVFHITWRVKQNADHRSRLGFLLFIFSFVRSVALVLRIAWASRPTNINLAIAANVFTAAGVVILFIVNLIFARRILNDYCKFGKHKAFDYALRFLIFCVAASIIMLVAATVYSFFTLDAAKRLICRKIQLFGSTYLALLAFLPIPAAIMALLFPNDATRTDAYLRRRFRAKVQLLLTTATLLTLGAGFRCGTNFDARPLGHPTWFHHKAAFYCFNFGIEVIVLYIYAAARFDSRLRLRQPVDTADAENSNTSGTEKAAFRESKWHRLVHDREMFGGGGWDQ